MDKEYIWPNSFPNCTPALHILCTVVDRWIRHHFHRKSRAKCLILIGPSDTGKTTFAKSLPGSYNYFNEQWRLDDYNDTARYSIYDNIGWDRFEEYGYPSKKRILTQDGRFNATDESERIKEINNRQPAIVLLNSGEPFEGSLTREPITDIDRYIADYWSKRATVFRMGNR